MRTEDINPTLRNALGTLEVFMRLGFPRTALSPAPRLSKEGKVLWTLTWEGHTFNATCGSYEVDSMIHLRGTALLAHFTASWREVAVAAGEGRLGAAVLDDCYHGAPATKESQRFLKALLATGIRPPGGVDVRQGLRVAVGDASS